MEIYKKVINGTETIFRSVCGLGVKFSLCRRNGHDVCLSIDWRSVKKTIKINLNEKRVTTIATYYYQMTTLSFCDAWLISCFYFNGTILSSY